MKELETFQHRLEAWDQDQVGLVSLGHSQCLAAIHGGAEHVDCLNHLEK